METNFKNLQNKCPERCNPGCKYYSPQRRGGYLCSYEGRQITPCRKCLYSNESLEKQSQTSTRPVSLKGVRSIDDSLVSP